MYIINAITSVLALNSFVSGDPVKTWSSNELAAHVAPILDEYLAEESKKELAAILNAATQSRDDFSSSRRDNQKGKDSADLFSLSDFSINTIFNESLSKALEPLKNYAVFDLVKAESAKTDANKSLKVTVNGSTLDYVPVTDTELYKLLLNSFSVTDLDRLKSFLELQLDLIPIIHNSFPGIHQAMISALDALNTMQPSTMNTLNFIPAIIEFTSSIIVLEGSSEPIAIMLNLYARAFRNVLEDFRLLVNYFSKANIVDKIKEALDTDSSQSAEIDQLVNVFRQIAPDIRNISRVVEQESTVVSQALKTLFDISNDLNDSLKEVLALIEKDHFVNKNVYDNPEQFLPILFTNFSKILRRGGIINHQKEINEALKGIMRILEAVEQINRHKVETLLETLIRLSVNIPRIPGLFETSSNLFIDASVILTHFFYRALPASKELINRLIYLSSSDVHITELIYEITPSLKHLNLVLPEFVVFIPLNVPFLRSINELTSYLIKMVNLLMLVRECDYKPKQSNLSSDTLHDKCASSLLVNSLVTFNEMLIPAS